MSQDVYIYDPNVPVPKDVRHVEIPEGVTVIRGDPFYQCSRLESVKIPDSVTKIGERTFCRCSALQSVVMPDSVTEIGYSAFQYCSGLQSVVIPDSVTKIGNGAFWHCSGLQSVTIPNGVTEISIRAFSDCSALQSVTIQDGVTKIGISAFDGCSGLQSVTIPDSVTKIEYSAFEGCSGLQSIIIPDGVTKISTRTFYGCSGLQSVTIPDSVTKIGGCAFTGCSTLRSVIISDSVTKISGGAFYGCTALRSFMYKGINIAPFISIDGYGVDTFDVIKALIEHKIPLSENTIRQGIDAAHHGRLIRWAQEYPVFGEMHLPPAAKCADSEEKKHLRELFVTQKRTGYRIPEILDELATAVHVCGIPPERLAATFDVEYTKALIGNRIPVVPAEVCRCYFNRSICDTLIKKEKISVMAETVRLYNLSRHQACYKHLTDFILSHTDTKTEDLQYAVDHAAEIPMEAGTTLTQVRRHRTYTENLAEVTKIEAEYDRVVPGFKLSDYPCNIEPVSITYNGMTARVLDLSEDRDIALAAGLGELTNCCQSLGKAGETAMMHGFLNPDAGFWVIEDRDGKVKAQAEIWESDKGILVFDNIEFADTDDEHLAHRIEQLRGIIAAWAMKSGYENIIMGCGYNELKVCSMERAPIPELRLTPEEVFALQKDNEAEVSFENIDAVHRYMQSEEYSPDNFVYTDANEQCVYIRKNGTVSDYLMRGYDERLAGGRNPHEQSLPVEKADGISV